MLEYFGSYFIEAKWANDGYTPTMEEHKEVTIVSSGYKFILVASFAAMGDEITDETFKWALTMPPLARACCLHCRIMDDLVTYKVHRSLNYVDKHLSFVAVRTSTHNHLIDRYHRGKCLLEEQQRRHVISAVECYMKEFDVTEQQSCELLNENVEDAWIEMNKEGLICEDVKIRIIMLVINMARMMEVLYKDKDHFTHVSEELMNHIKSLVSDDAIIV